MRVLHLIKGLSIGGAERLLASACEVRDRERFDYEVAYVLSPHSGIAGDIARSGVRVRCLGGPNQFDLRWLARLRAVLRAERFDILHVHLPYTSAFGRFVARSLPAQVRPVVVATQHSVWDQPSRLMRALNLPAIWLDGAHISVSQAVRSSLPQRLRSRTEVIVHGVLQHAPEEYSGARAEVRTELGVPDAETLFVTVANYRPEKGHEVLLDAVKLLADEGLPFRLAAIGHGETEDAVRAQQLSLGLERHFLMLGAKSDAVRWVAGADAFVLASHTEGFPVAVMEAMTVGTPVVATAVGAIPDAITPGVDGFVVPPGDATQLAAAMKTLITDPDRRRRMRDAAAMNASEFDIRTAVRRTEQIYEDLVRSARG